MWVAEPDFDHVLDLHICLDDFVVGWSKYEVGDKYVEEGLDLDHWKSHTNTGLSKCQVCPALV